MLKLCSFTLVYTNQTKKYFINLNDNINNFIEKMKENIYPDFNLINFQIIIKTTYDEISLNNSKSLDKSICDFLIENNILPTDNLNFFVLPEVLQDLWNDSKKKICPICFEKKMLESNYKCNNHGICHSCFLTWSKNKNQANRMKCPICRNSLKEKHIEKKNFTNHGSITRPSIRYQTDDIITRLNNRVVSDFIPSRIRILNNSLTLDVLNTVSQIRNNNSQISNRRMSDSLLPFYNPAFVRHNRRRENRNTHNFRRNNSRNNNSINYRQNNNLH